MPIDAAKPSIVLIGGGGHCHACIDVIELENKYNIAGIVDTKDKIGQKVLNYKIIADDADLPELRKEFDCFFISLGQIKTPERRIELFNVLLALDANLPTIVSPLAYISKYARIGKGSIVMHYAFLNANCRVGDNCIINSKSLIEHDVKVGNHCHVSTGAILNGNCKIGEKVFVGSNSVCRDSIRVGAGSILGCASNILTDINPQSLIK